MDTVFSEVVVVVGVRSMGWWVYVIMPLYPSKHPAHPQPIRLFHFKGCNWPHTCNRHGQSKIEPNRIEQRVHFEMIV